jgi:type 1 glutamine amidotransferase
LRIQLYNSAGQAVGTAKTVNFTVNPTQTPVLISQNKTVTTSAVMGGNTGAAAVDGNMATRWESVFADNQFIQIDLGTKLKISQIVLEWEAAYGKGYVIEVSDTGTGGWTELFRTTTGNGGQDALTVNGQGRYVRLTGITRGTQYGFSLWEFRVYGNSLDVVTTPTISIASPTAGQQFVLGNSVSLQVGVSDATWFSSGGSYRYSLNNAAAIRVANATPVNLGALPVGDHNLVVTLLNAQNLAVGVSSTATFTVKTLGTTPPTPSPAKLAPTGSTASSFLGGNTVASAHDGNVATRWESAQTDTQYIQLDMGKSVYFTRAVLNWEAAYGKSYVIEVSETGATWEIANTTTNSDGGIDTLMLDGQKGRYIRMRGVQRATAYGYSLFEFEVYGVPADTNPALISFLSPANDAVIAQTEAVKFRVAITDANWMPNGGYVYALDTNPAVRVNNLNEINLGLLSTGQHSLRVSLVNSSGVEVSVPKVRKFRVSCGTTCPKVLVFSKTSGFRHDSIAAGIAMVQRIAQDNGYVVTASEDASLFTTANLAQYSTVVFMNTTGDIFTAAQEAAFRTYMETGGGFVGTHSAADTEHDWDWYTDTLFAGAEFIHHGDGIPRAKVKIEKPENALVKHIGTEWMLADEWYFWKASPRGVGNVEILGTLDRTSYTSNYPVADHPVIFTNIVGTGRMFYTAIGHVDGNFSDPNMVEMIRKGIEWTSN